MNILVIDDEKSQRNSLTGFLEHINHNVLAADTGQKGLEILKQASGIHPGWKYVGYGPAFIQTGHIDEGRAIIEELEAMPANGYKALCLAVMYCELEDYDKAFEWLNYEHKIGWYPWIRVGYHKMHKDPRFLKIIRDMNLPDPSPLVYYPEPS